MQSTAINKAAELKERIRKSIETLANETDAARQSELFKAYLRTSSAFWNYSWGNQMLIYCQRPTATFVAGFRKWNLLNRFVKRGEKGIAILAPCPYKDKKLMAAGASEDEASRLGFRVVYVFDIAQTDGEALPEIPTSSKGARGQHALDLAMDFAASRGITVELKAIKRGPGGPFGFSKVNEPHIALEITSDAATQASVLFHELAHQLMHRTKEGREIGNQQRELQAESVAYVCSNYFGIECPSKFYLASYKVTPHMLLEAVETIAETVKTILSGCEKESSASKSAAASEELAAA